MKYKVLIAVTSLLIIGGGGWWFFQSHQQNAGADIVTEEHNEIDTSLVQKSGQVSISTIGDGASCYGTDGSNIYFTSVIYPEEEREWHVLSGADVATFTSEGGTVADCFAKDSNYFYLNDNREAIRHPSSFVLLGGFGRGARIYRDAEYLYSIGSAIGVEKIQDVSTFHVLEQPQTNLDGSLWGAADSKAFYCNGDYVPQIDPGTAVILWDMAKHDGQIYVKDKNGEYPNCKAGS